MKLVASLFFLIGPLITPCLNAETTEDLHLEIKLELMAFGAGVAEGVHGLGELSRNGSYQPMYADIPALPIVVEQTNGLKIARVQTADGKLLLRSLVVIKPNFRMPIGEFRSISKVSLQQNIGSPDEIAGDSYIYHIPSYIGSDDLKFTFHKDTLQCVEWVWNFD